MVVLLGPKGKKKPFFRGRRVEYLAYSRQSARKRMRSSIIVAEIRSFIRKRVASFGHVVKVGHFRVI
jgi:hypothetical protein